MTNPMTRAKEAIEYYQKTQGWQDEIPANMNAFLDRPGHKMHYADLQWLIDRIETLEVSLKSVLETSEGNFGDAEQVSSLEQALKKARREIL